MSSILEEPYNSWLVILQLDIPMCGQKWDGLMKL